MSHLQCETSLKDKIHETST